MPPTLALAIWFVFLLALFVFDPAKYKTAPSALWVPVIWMFFLASRPPAMWLGTSTATDAVQALEQGNPVDRTIFSGLTLIAFVILVSRSFPWGKFVGQNLPLVSFLAFGLLSVAWSDFPLASFKKWFRDLGIYMAILVVLSDPRPHEAIRTALRRLCYLLIPLSVLLIKYYPELGRTFTQWGGQEYTGVATSKNVLGVVCLLSGIYFFWDTITNWQRRTETLGRRVILVNIAFIGMTLWLLRLSASKTSTICLAFGCSLIAATHCRFGRRHPRLIKALAPMAFVAYVTLAWGFGMAGQISEAAGRTADMSDRTRIWKALLDVPINPVLGTGYQSFWLSRERVQLVWAEMAGDNVLVAHNGYLQTYLDLGLIGLFLAGAFLIATYRRLCRQVAPLTPLGSLGLGLWIVLVFYNVTEAALGGGLLWLLLLMASATNAQGAKNELKELRTRGTYASLRAGGTLVAPTWRAGRAAGQGSRPSTSVSLHKPASTR